MRSNMSKTLVLIATSAIFLTLDVGVANADRGTGFVSDGRQMRAEAVNSCEKRRYACVQDLGPTPRRMWQVSSCNNDYHRCLER